MMLSLHSVTRIYRGLTVFSLLALYLFCNPVKSDAQVLRVLTNNTFSGTVNGALLGGATMALANSDEFSPVRIGVGLGTLSGMGIGIYEASNNMGYVQGTFNSVNHTGYIILVDTFYGAATGTVVGVAIALLGNNRVVYGAQYGVGAGAWVGFTFGLVDAFYLSHDTDKVDYFSSRRDISPGLLHWQPAQNSQVSFFNPSIYSFPGMTDQTLTMNAHFGMEVARLSMRF